MVDVSGVPLTVALKCLALKYVAGHTAVFQLFILLALGNFAFLFIFCIRKIHIPVTLIYQPFSVVQDVWIKFKSRESVTDYIEAKLNRSEFLCTKVCFTCPFADCEKRLLTSSCLSVCLSLCPRGISRLPRERSLRNLIFNSFSKIRQENSNFIKI